MEGILCSSRLRNIQERGDWCWVEHCGAPGHRGHLVPHSSLHDLLWVPKGRTVVNRSSSHETLRQKLTKIRWATEDCAHLSAVPHFGNCRRKKNTRLLLPWSLWHTPAWLYNVSLLTSEWGHSFWGTSLLCSPFAGKIIKPLFLSPP